MNRAVLCAVEAFGGESLVALQACDILYRDKMRFRYFNVDFFAPTASWHIGYTFTF